MLCVVWIAFMPQWEELYLSQVVLPQLERRYEFQRATVRFMRDGSGWESTGIVGVVPGSELARLGVRDGDVPYAYHGGGWTYFAHALAAYERNRPAEFDVVHAQDWSAGRGREAARTIRVRRR